MQNIKIHRRKYPLLFGKMVFHNNDATRHYKKAQTDRVQSTRSVIIFNI